MEQPWMNPGILSAVNIFLTLVRSSWLGLVYFPYPISFKVIITSYIPSKVWTDEN